MENLKIFEEIRAAEKQYDEPIELESGLPFKQKDQIRSTTFYINSRYLNGQKDKQGREKPFYNVINGMVDVEDSAKDINTKDCTVESKTFGSGFERSFIASKELQDWMDETGWGIKLNRMRTIHTVWGSLLVKKVICEDKGKKYPDIEFPLWKNLTTDQVDILNGIIIEDHYMLPSKLISKKGVWDNVNEALKLRKNSERKGFSSSQRIHIKEVRGYFPLSVFNECAKQEDRVNADDENEYTYQLYYIATDGNKNIVLYYENNTEEIYKYLKRKSKDGRDFGVGVPEEQEQAQIWTNDVVQKQHRVMELTSKVIGQSSSKKLKGRNLNSEVDDGVILEIEDGKPITRLELTPSGGMGQFSSVMEQWFKQAEQVSSKYDAQRGETPSSGTPFRLQALVLNQSNSVHLNLKQDLELFVGEILTDWILPDLMKKINKKHLLERDYTTEELKEIDKNFATYSANEAAKNKILSGELITPEEYEALLQVYKEQIGSTKSRRFLDIPDGYFKDMEAKVKVYTSNEQRNKAAVLESLFNIMIIYKQNPNLANDPVLTKIFSQMVEMSGAGISPISLMSALSEAAKLQSQTPQQSDQQPQMPQMERMSLQANPLNQVNA